MAVHPTRSGIFSSRVYETFPLRRTSELGRSRSGISQQIRVPMSEGAPHPYRYEVSSRLLAIQPGVSARTGDAPTRAVRSDSRRSSCLAPIFRFHLSPSCGVSNEGVVVSGDGERPKMAELRSARRYRTRALLRVSTAPGRRACRAFA